MSAALEALQIDTQNQMVESNALSKKSEPEVDTDLPKNRLKRAINHYQFEQTVLPVTFGLTFKERFLLIRASLFKGFSNISGEDYKKLLSEGKVLSDSRAQIEDEFMPSNEAAEVAIEGYMATIDSWYQDIQALPEGRDKKEAAFRMLAALFVIGVLIHPTRDGNGQTFKGVTLSYLHDLLPEMRDYFIPIKYTSDTHKPTHEMAISFMGGGMLAMENDLTAGAVPKIEPKSDKDRRIMQGIEQANEIQRTPFLESETLQEYDKKTEAALSSHILELARELNMPHITERDIIRYDTSRQFVILKKKFLYTHHGLLLSNIGVLNTSKNKGILLNK